MILEALALTVLWQPPQAAFNAFHDEKVANIAILHAFLSHSTSSSWWSRGKYIVLKPNWHGKERPSLNLLVEQGIFHYSGVRKFADQLTQLKRIKRSIGPSVGQNILPDPIPLGQMILDERILVGVKLENRTERSVGWFPGDFEARNRQGVRGVVKTIVGLKQPCYSRDLRFACVVMNVPWSIHSADVECFLEQVDGKWKPLAVIEYFYL